jgi:hypothetical protein
LGFLYVVYCLSQNLQVSLQGFRLNHSSHILE